VHLGLSVPQDPQVAPIVLPEHSVARLPLVVQIVPLELLVQQELEFARIVPLGLLVQEEPGLVRIVQQISFLVEVLLRAQTVLQDKVPHQ